MSVKAKGKRGSWFAEANGENLPCVHKYWSVWDKATKKLSYLDKGIKPGAQDDFVEAIRKTKRVILTDDNLLENGAFERTKYIAVYDVENVDIDNAGLRFEFTKKILNLA